MPTEILPSLRSSSRPWADGAAATTSTTWLASASATRSRESWVWARSATPARRCRTSVLMAYPNRITCKSGTPTIMPKVSLSLRSWRTSFPAMARMRRRLSSTAGHPFITLEGCGGDEHVFQVRGCLLHLGFQARPEAQVQETPANLEDVFVASTSFEGDERVARRA